MTATDTYRQVDMFCPRCDQPTEHDAVRKGPPWIATVKCIACGNVTMTSPCDAP